MSVRRYEAVINQTLDLRVHFRWSESGQLFDPYQISKVEILDSDGTTIIETITSITKISTGEYSVIAAAIATPKIVYDKWYYTLVDGASETSVINATSVAATSVGAGTSFSDNDTIRILGQLDDTVMVPEALISLRRMQAYNLICRYLKPEYKAKNDAGTLTTDELWDLKIGEAELAVSILCKSLALRFTLYKFNRSLSSGLAGGESERDSRKNLDFRLMRKDWWLQAWGTLTDYVTSIPNMGDGGGLDPYSFFNFGVVKNTDLEALSEEEESLEVQWG